MPALPKANPARRNKSTSRATLPRDHDVEMPELPAVGDDERGLHPMTVRWWRDIWSSPMAPEFEKSDIHGLFILAALVDSFWWKPSRESAAEIRLQRQAFGLTPIDRRRLQWEIERGEDAEERTAKRRESKPKSNPDGTVGEAGVDDPRAVLRLA